MVRKVAGLALASVLVGACRATPPPPPERAAAAPLTLEVGGCAAVLRGPVCEIGGGAPLRLWVAARDDATVSVSAEGAALPLQARPLRGGRRLDVLSPPTPARLAIEVRGSDGASQRGELVLAPPMPPSDVIEQASKLRKANDTAGARALLEPRLATLPPRVRARAHGLLARADLAEGRTEAALAGLALAGQLAAESGELSLRASDAAARARALAVQARRPHEASTLLAEVASEVAQASEAAAEIDYARGVVAYELGDVALALASLDAAGARAERIGLDPLRVRVHQLSAHVLRELGDPERGAGELAAARLLVSADPCERARFLTDVGWFTLQGRDRAAARAPLEEALALYRGACPRPVPAQNVLVNLALASSGREEAREHLRAARAIGPLPPSLAVWALEAEATAAARPADALAAWTRIDALALAAALPDARWRAQVGSGDALLALGRPDAAIEAYREAESVLDDRVQRVPASSGRDGYLGGRDRAARALLDLLVERGRAPEALEALRRSRSRALASLGWSRRLGTLPPEQRRRWQEALERYRSEREALTRESAADWELSAPRLAAARAARKPREDAIGSRLNEAFGVLGAVEASALAALAPGEVVIAIHPGREGWTVIAASAERVEARRGRALDPEMPPAALAAELLQPFQGLIGAARRIRVWQSGALAAVDVHALPFRGEPLVALAPVVYDLDLPRAERSAPGDTALVVSDTLGDLPAARREAAAVEQALRATPGGAALVGLGGPTLNHAALGSALAAAASLHWAGHATYAPDALASGFPLGGGSSFTAADVLTLPRVPRRVVLSACESARAPLRASALGLGLAQAFMVVGTEEALAASRPVADAAAEAFVRALYASPALAADLAAAARDAALTLRRQQPSADWASYRAMAR
jgi:cellulose synthase operon protein C